MLGTWFIVNMYTGKSLKYDVYNLREKNDIYHKYSNIKDNIGRYIYSLEFIPDESLN